MRRHILQLSVTRRCNIHCRHCYQPDADPPPDPSIETIERVFEQFKRLARSYGERGRHVLNLSGGEPTLRGDLEGIIRLAGRRGFAVRLSTNAIGLNGTRARSLRRAGLSAAQVSLDGADQETYEAIRGPGTWDRVNRGTRALVAAGIPVVLSQVLLPGVNLEEAPQLLDLVVAHRAVGAKFARPVREGAMIRSGWPVEGDYWQVFREILEHARRIRYRRFLFIADPLAHRLRTAERDLARGLPGLVTDLCDCRRTRVVEIDAATGDVYYCRLRQRLGNLGSEDLVRMWRCHPLLAELRFRKEPDGCAGCVAWAQCQGGCPAVMAVETGRRDAPDQACPGPLTARGGRAEALLHSARRRLSPGRWERLEASFHRVRHALLWRLLRLF